MEGTINSLKIAQKQENHDLVMGTADSKAKWQTVAKLAENRYDMNPKLDGDVVSTFRHVEQAEDKLGVTMVQTQSDPCWGDSCEMYAVDKPPKGFKKDYPVPSFGADPDMEGTMASLKSAEAITEHKLEMGTAASKQKWKNVAKEKPNRYNYYPKLDGDIVTTQKNLGNAEESLGTQFAQFIQTTSDPCLGDGCGVYKLPHVVDSWKKDYAVPNFGADPEVASVMDSIKIAEKQEKHELVMGTADSKAKWKNVAKLAENRYDMDPKLDDDVKATNQNIEAAEDKIGVPLVNYWQ